MKAVVLELCRGVVLKSDHDGDSHDDGGDDDDSHDDDDDGELLRALRPRRPSQTPTCGSVRLANWCFV